MSKANLNNLPPGALSAAMRGGTDGWGQWGSATGHIRYAIPIRSRGRRRCICGCGKRATHVGAANGIALMNGCVLAVARWVKNPFWRGAANRQKA